MNLTTSKLVTIIFTIVTIVSASYIVFAATNYDNYYWQARSAVLNTDTNNTTIDNIQLAGDNTNTTIQILVSVSNPTGYSGLTFDSSQVNLFFYHTGNTSSRPFEDSLIASKRLDQPLPPYSTIKTNLYIQLSPSQSNKIQTFKKSYAGQVVAYTVLTTFVDSFLDPVFGRMSPLKQQEIPIV